MTPERFHSLLDAFGADLRRWPEAEREGARALIANGPAALRSAIADAALLDRDLDKYQVAAPEISLLERIVGGAPSAASTDVAPARPATLQRLPARFFWPPAGWALTGLAGAVAGALAVSVVLGDAGPAAATDWQKGATAFTDRAADWSEE